MPVDRPSVLRASLAAAAAVAALLWYRRRRQIAGADPSVPAVHLWTDVVLPMVRTKSRDLMGALTQAILDRFPGESVVIIRTYPFSDVYVLKNADGVKLFHGSKDLDLPEGYNTLLGPVRPVEVNEAGVSGKVDMISMVAKSFRSENLAKFAARVVVPEIEAFIAQYSGGADPAIPDCIDAVYILITRIAVRVFGEHTFGKNQERINRLCKLMQDTDIENLIKKSPLNAVAPNLPHVRREREGLYDQLREVLNEIVDDYIAGHRDVLELTGDARDDFADRDLAEAAIRGMWDPATKTVNKRLVFGTLDSLLFAAVSNQYVITSLYLAHLDTKPEFKAAVMRELQPLTQWLTARAHAKKSALYVPEFDDAMPLEILDNMPLLEAGVLETIRLGSVGFAPRVTSKEILFKTSSGAEVRIPAGSFVTSSHGMVHRNPEINPDPLAFRPERFIDPASGANMGPAAASTRGFFIGFGAGRHPCTGTRFAMQQIKLVVALLSIHWETKFDPLPPVETQLVGIARPIRPLRMSISLRPQQ